MSIQAGQNEELPASPSWTASEPCGTSLARKPLDEDSAADLARVLKALADPVRLRLVSLISGHDGGEACVCDLTAAFDLTQPTISHHLRILREAGILDCERRGIWAYYRVVSASLDRVAAMLAPSAASAR